MVCYSLFIPAAMSKMWRTAYEAKEFIQDESAILLFDLESDGRAKAE